MHVLPVAEVVKKEQEIAAQGTPLKELMARAGQSVYRYLLEKFPEKEGKKAVVFAGSGNNGGDGWVVAHLLAQAGWNVSLVSARAAEDIKAEPACETAVELCALWAGAPSKTPHLYLNPSTEELISLLTQADVIIDGILGTGFSQSSIRAPFDTWISLANQERTRRDVFCLAIDIPSGISADTGAASNPCFIADATVTMIAYKPAFAMEPCARYLGESILAPLV